MPIFEYRCGKGHASDHLHRWSDGERPQVVACPVEGCGEPAGYHFAPPAPTMGCKPEPKAIEIRPMTGFTNHAFQCSGCGHLFEELVDWSAGEDPEDGKPCPECKQKAVVRLMANVAAWSVKTFGAQGGYYDRGLGQWIHSAAEREEVMRAKGLVAYDDDDNNWMDREFGRIDTERAKEDKELAEYDDRLKNHPGFAPLRRAQDLGLE